MTQTNFEIVWVMSRRNFYHACSKILFYIRIRHNWNFSANQWKSWTSMGRWMPVFVCWTV